VNRRTFLRRGAGLVGTVLSASILQACGGASPAPAAASAAKPASAAAPASAQTSAAGQALKKLRYGATGSIGADAGGYIAMDQGFFAEQGVALDLVPFATAVDMIAPLATGQLDVIGGVTSAGLWNAVSRGAAIKVVAGASQSDPGPPPATVTTFLVRKTLADSGRVKSMADIKGLNVVSPPPGNAVELLWSLIFKSAGLSKNDLNTLTLPITEVGAALINGKVDVAATNEPSTTIVLNQGAGSVLLHDYEVYARNQVGVLFYGPDFARSDLAVPFMMAYLKAARLYNDAFVKKLPDARAKVIRALVANTTLKDASLYDKMTVPRFDPNGELNAKSLQDQQDYFISAGEQPKPVDLNSVVDMQYAKAAVAKLGPYS